MNVPNTLEFGQRVHVEGEGIGFVIGFADTDQARYVNVEFPERGVRKWTFRVLVTPAPWNPRTPRAILGRVFARVREAVR